MNKKIRLHPIGINTLSNILNGFTVNISKTKKTNVKNIN